MAADYPLNQWYAAAFSDQLGDKPLARTILGQPMALFRAGDGSPVALLDRCPHRGVSLSYGRCEARGISCAYHGWLYDVQGNCLETPAEPARVIFLATTARTDALAASFARRGSYLPVAK